MIYGLLWLVLIFFLIVFMTYFIESMFCHKMKNKKPKQVVKSETSGEKKKADDSRSMKAIVFDFLNGLCFLSFKLTGYIPSHWIRLAIYRNVYCMTIAKRAVIHYGLEARSPWNIRIGTGTIIGDHCILDARCGIEIGSNCNFSSGVWIWTLQHNVNAADFGTEGEGAKVIIEDRAWVSCRTTVLPGCIIKKGCVIAAGAVMTKSCSGCFEIYGGVPAKHIGERNTELTYELGGKHRWFL